MCVYFRAFNFAKARLSKDILIVEYSPFMARFRNYFIIIFAYFFQRTFGLGKGLSQTGWTQRESTSANTGTGMKMAT